MDTIRVSATAKYVRISPEKVRLIIGQIKRMPPESAIKILNFVPKKAALILKKVIASAIANAKNNYGLREDSLVFKEIQVGKGSMFKRYRPVSRGRVHPILKRTSHIRVVLEGEQKAPESKQAQSEVKTEKKEPGSQSVKIKNQKAK